MASKATAFLAFFLALNLLFFSLVTACNGCYVPSNPNATPSHDEGKKCSRDILKFSVCAKLLDGLLDIPIGKPPVSTPCCSLMGGLVDLEAAVCLCTAIKANVLGHILNIPLSLSLVLNACNKKVPNGFEC